MSVREPYHLLCSTVDKFRMGSIEYDEFPSTIKMADALKASKLVLLFLFHSAAWKRFFGDAVLINVVVRASRSKVPHILE